MSLLCNENRRFCGSCGIVFADDTAMCHIGSDIEMVIEALYSLKSEKDWPVDFVKL